MYVKKDQVRSALAELLSDFSREKFETVVNFVAAIQDSDIDIIIDYPEIEHFPDKETLGDA